MSFHIFSIGILFNALTCGVVAASALALTIFIMKRLQRVSLAMQAYAWFWWFTALLWLPLAIRYLVVGVGYTGPWIRLIDIVVQMSICFTGPPLFYYLSLQVFRSELLANALSLASALLGIISTWFLLQPNGISVHEVTFFSAEATANTTSLIIFFVEVSIILACLLYDVVVRLRRWYQTGASALPYEAMYSSAIVIYLIIGSVDESKIITDWPIVVFRLLYAGIFLFVYLTISQHDASGDYLVDDTASPGSYA